MLTLIIRTTDTAEVIMQLSVCQYIYNSIRNEIRFRINLNGSTVCLKCSSVDLHEGDLNIYLDETIEELERKLWS